MELRERLARFRDKRVLIYGTGVSGQNAAEQLREGFPALLGFTNSYNERRTLLDLPVYPLEEALGLRPELILVAAQMAAPVIASGIAPFCREHGILLYDLSGNDLLAPREADFAFRPGAFPSLEEARAAIAGAEAVSFDLFDTLVARNALYPSDIASCVDARLREQGVVIRDFCRRRTESFRRLAASAWPRLEAVYREMLTEEEKRRVSPEELAVLEWETDTAFFVPRKDMCGLAGEAAAAGKRIYIVTDTWYSEGQVGEILARCGIPEPSGIFASCEYGMGKQTGLFRALLRREAAEGLLHIGDNRAADGVCARSAGIRSFLIPAGTALFEALGGLGLPAPEGLSGRIRLGMLIASVFNSPFPVSEGRPALTVSDIYDFAFLFYGPVLGSFTQWLHRQLRAAGLQNLWFTARDGYVMQRLYRLLDPEDRSVYLLTSRVAALRTGMRRTEDILSVERTGFRGDTARRLRERYGVDPGPGAADGSVLDYRDAILAASEKARRGMERYLGGIALLPGPIALFDAVGRGTVQLHLQALLDRPLLGFYLLRLEDNGNPDYGRLDIRSYYPEEEARSSAMSLTWSLLEFFLTAPFPCLECFAEDGTARYRAEFRSGEELESTLRAQEGILDWFRTYLSLCPAAERQEDRALCDAILGLMTRAEVTDRRFLALRRDDTVTNRIETAGECLRALRRE